MDTHRDLLNLESLRIIANAIAIRDNLLESVMEEPLINILLNGGANIAFAAFLYMQNQQLQKRADERELKQDKREADIRARYDKVIADMYEREDAIRRELVQEINDLDKKGYYFGD